MPLHDSTFNYLKPTHEELDKMNMLRTAAAHYARTLEIQLPEGPDKTYTLRKLREVAMWANVALTRQADGSPRDSGANVDPKDYPPDHPVKGDLGSVPT